MNPPGHRPRRLMFFSTSYGIAMAFGATAPWLPERIFEFCASALIVTATLWWQWRDAQRRHVPSGTWIPALFVMMNPLGMLLWLLRSRGAWGLSAFPLYVLAMAGFYVAVAGGAIAATLIRYPALLRQ
jgi:hypothetical protein